MFKYPINLGLPPKLYDVPDIRIGVIGKQGRIFNFSFCKEYVLDDVANAINGTKGYEDISLDEIIIATAEMSDVSPAIKFVNQFEDVLNIQKTTVYKYSKESYVFVGSKIWMIAPPVLSMYTMLIRGGKNHPDNLSLPDVFTYYENHRSYQPLIGNTLRDINYMKQSLPAIKCIIKHGIESMFGSNYKANWKNEGIYIAPEKAQIRIHDSGIVNFSNKKLKEAKPNWYSISLK